MSIYSLSDNPIIVIGAGAVGQTVAKVLDSKETPYYLIDTTTCPMDLKVGTFIQGDAKDRAVLERAGIKKAPTVVITTSDDSINGYLTLYCRSLNKDIRIVSRANFHRNFKVIHKAGADFVVSYTMIGTSIVNNILQKGELTLLAEGLHIFKHKTPEHLVGKTIAESEIGTLTGCNIIALQKNNTIDHTLTSSTVIKREDLLVMLGNIEQEEKFNDLFIN